jgi:hypothetical protein
MKRDIIDTLSLHFGCLNEQVTCSRVKPFLPGLLMPSVPIRIPTPITVHLDHCPECAKDLEALRRLGLDPEQVERLEQLYERGAPTQFSLCRRSRVHIAAFVRGSFDNIDSEILNHLCTCPKCRAHAYRSRQELLTSCPADESGKAAACAAEISTARLFDYAVPYGRTAAGPEWAPEAHVQSCRSCLTRIQRLADTLYGIAARTDSGVTTTYSTLDAAEPARQVEAQAPAGENVLAARPNPYADYPIEVQVIRPLPARVPAPAKVKAVLRHTTCNPQVRFFLKTALAAAAVILLAVLFHGTPSTTSGMTLGQVCQAFEKAENIHVSRFDPTTDRPVREFWMSRSLNMVLRITGQETILYDLGAGKEYTRETLGGAVQAAELTDRHVAYAQERLTAGLGFRPDQVPSGARWIRVDDDARGAERYELNYSEQDPTGTVSLRKRVFVIDPTTKRPQEVQEFHKSPAESEWHPLVTTRYQYPTVGEMNKVLGGQGLGNGTESY